MHSSAPNEHGADRGALDTHLTPFSRRSYSFLANLRAYAILQVLMEWRLSGRPSVCPSTATPLKVLIRCTRMI